MPHRPPRSPSQVATLGHGVDARPSTIPGAGVGLFAARPYGRREYITYMSGELVSRAEAAARAARGAGTHLKPVWPLAECIDGVTGATARPGDGGASLVNDARDPARTNTFWDRRDGVLYLRAARDVAAGEELFVSYGRGYWAAANLRQEPH